MQARKHNQNSNTENPQEIRELIRKFQSRLFQTSFSQARPEIEREARRLGIDPDVAWEIAQIANSIGQRLRSEGGGKFQRCWCNFIDSILARNDSPFVLERRYKLPRHRARPLDGFLSTEKTNWFFSLKTSPRERAATTWPIEFREVSDFSKRQGKSVRFVALTIDPVNLLTSGAMPHEVSYGSARDYDFVSKIVHEILDDVT